MLFLLAACTAPDKPVDGADTADTDDTAAPSGDDADGDGFPSWRTTDDPALADCDDADPAVTPDTERYVAAGPFVRGDDETPLSSPAREITLSAYCIDRTEVTNEAFVALLQAREDAGQHNVDDLGQTLFDLEDTDDTYPERLSYADGAWQIEAGYERHPVVEVWNWSGAFYCASQGKALPTEAQWEKAARGATDTRMFPWGDDPPECAFANFLITADPLELCVGDTVETGVYDNASPYGVLDMAGNVAEWVSDWFDPDGYATDPDTDPTGPAEGQTYTDNKNTYIARVTRGGTYLQTGDWLRVVTRMAEPEWATSNGVGFRCARALGE